MRWPFLLILVAGCAGSQPALEDARSAVKQAGEDLQRMRELIVAGCSEPPPAPAFCAELVQQFNKVQATYTAVNEAMP